MVQVDVFWSYGITEYNIALRFGSTGTAIVLSNRVSEENARECFERLTFEVVE